jgi:hypothetical protein
MNPIIFRKAATLVRPMPSIHSSCFTSRKWAISQDIHEANVNFSNHISLNLTSLKISSLATKSGHASHEYLVILPITGFVASGAFDFEFYSAGICCLLGDIHQDRDRLSQHFVKECKSCFRDIFHANNCNLSFR